MTTITAADSNDNYHECDTTTGNPAVMLVTVRFTLDGRGHTVHLHAEPDAHDGGLDAIHHAVRAVFVRLDVPEYMHASLLAAAEDAAVQALTRDRVAAACAAQEAQARAEAEPDGDGAAGVAESVELACEPKTEHEEVAPLHEAFAFVIEAGGGVGLDSVLRLETAFAEEIAELNAQLDAVRAVSVEGGGSESGNPMATVDAARAAAAREAAVQARIDEAMAHQRVQYAQFVTDCATTPELLEALAEERKVAAARNGDGSDDGSESDDDPWAQVRELSVARKWAEGHAQAANASARSGAGSGAGSGGNMLGWLKSGLRTALSPVKSSSALLVASRRGDESTPSVKPAEGSDASEAPAPDLTEGFTIYLGAQLKTNYSIRLSLASMASSLVYDTSSKVTHIAQRAATALALYSEQLAAVVVLVDADLSYATDEGRAFAAAARASTELHFASLSVQVEAVRAQARAEGASLVPGDVFVTRHSNLAGIQLAFHLVVDLDTMHMRNADLLRGRNPMLAGLRSVLHTAARYDVCTISLPLLLSHSLPAGMDLADSAVTKRAETVLKAVKGVLTERGNIHHSLRSVHFYHPPAVFDHFRTLLCSVFTVS
ncbi:uncharacterized protein AMSG_08123 [Thecamonas trahens ATCC 50062]|uniref:Macro domain-containing protein n=1 Tax=Thecamonas trahens ATCC 50062 TaxID=461836 RepID=A0A0L0DKI1_THETB|nr:hypothetical protein AMSG_08123 [Thecamonas trahens ATCC 50062]KNC52556.1 hypothetical protein AMSG_08123 [Thecamonas trahens ATCC 50062]|eukprot:XP_013755346.1 hypothetical protein AMSG_08123 [Thecamonas trahens ATCC 50062]